MTAEWKLGNSRPVNRIGFGAMQLPKWPGGPPADRDRAIEVLRTAVELGVNHIDTAGFYVQDGVSANELIREALHPYPDNLVLATKIGPRFVGDSLTPAPYAEPGELRRELEANLTELGVDHIDLVNLRVGGVEGPSGEPFGAHFKALAALREEGLVSHLGVSNVTAAGYAEARVIAPVAAVQNHYNLVHRDDDELVDACAEQGTAFVPFWPLGGHIDPEFLDDSRFTAVAARHGVNPSQVALAWLLQRSPNILLIPGTSSIDHLRDNMAAANLTLIEQDLAELNAVASGV